MQERARQNKKASAVVGATIFRKHGTLQPGERPWSAVYTESLLEHVKTHKPTFVSAVFDNPAWQIGAFCRSCGAATFGLFLSWFQQPGPDGSAHATAVPNAMFFLGRASYQAPHPRTAPPAPEWLDASLGPLMRTRWTMDSAPHWESFVGVPDDVIEEVEGRPYIGKVSTKVPDPMW